MRGGTEADYSRNELDALARGERKEVIVAGSNRVSRRRVLRVSDHLRKLLEHEDEPTRVFRRNSTAEFRLGERSFYFVEQRLQTTSSN